ncbi:DUF983 domain-containing protein [Hymenobacter sp. BT770]|uniref:DUF983 domain-containing protein n=1 Tax=Hymenobacter sp. BT770 TaxID=2886942 RepID=UPI001D12CB54|nr:DUF983 domain-containing protein [Hymenobacter sp. BT770]MCC3152677.1 DUF983 domain-containing protein [Hymenobacter sp. BT770]MDO3414750.1 DUF983 domain-containing protein [Hymenobacter sp. BT770]
MATPPSSLLALLALRCPRCHQGKLFTHSALNLTKFDEMPEACPVCGQAFEPEVGFYWGAMYISYGFSTFIVAIVGVLLYFLGHDPDVWVYVVAVAAAVLAFTPLMFRYARAVMLYAFGGASFDPRYAKA